MAFGIKREELAAWKYKVKNGEIAFLTHHWIHPRFEGITTVTKAGCSNVDKLIAWGRNYGLKEQWIHKREEYPHFDLIGETQLHILKSEGQWEQVARFFEQK
jgi:hypothetical protein